MRLDSAAKEKLADSEQQATLTRLSLVAFCGLVYIALMDHTGTAPMVAYSVLALAGAYSAWLLAAEPYRKYNVLLTSAFMTGADAILVAAWVMATGGYESPFYLLWYLSLVALAFRYGTQETLVGAGAYSVIYAALLSIDVGLTTYPVDAVVRIGFLFLFAGMAALFSRVLLAQTEAKQDTRAMAEELEESLSLHETTLEATADGILATNLDGSVASYNQRFLDMWGIPEQTMASGDPNQILGAAVDMVADPGRFQESIEAMYQAPEAETYDVIHLTDGRIYERFSRPRRVQGEIVGRVSSFRDITEQAKAEAELREQAAELQQFAYVVSHDLQEPIRMITSYLQLLDRRYGEELGADAQELMAYAVDGGTRLSELVRALLAYTRVHTDAEPFGTTDVGVVVDQVQANLALAIEQAEATLEVGQMPTVTADANQLLLLFQNLVGNALKFQRPGVRPEVRLEAERTGDGWRFSVEDNGIGIPPDQQDRVFQVFQRLHRNDEVAGTGIGLAICKRIIDRHGGRIWVDSEPDVGSKFFFTLPDQPEEPEPPGPAAPPPQLREAPEKALEAEAT